MDIRSTTVLITGANRGIGRAFVEAFLARGAKRIYAGGRKLTDLEPVAALDRSRVIPLSLDVTKADQILSAADRTKDINLLVNNAGALSAGRASEINPESLRHDMEVNYFGMLAITRAMAPIIERNGGGAVVNLLSVVSLSNIPSAIGYGASKAAAWSATQGLRVDLAPKKIRVISVFPGPIDTDMAKDIPLDKTPPINVANEVLDAIAADGEDVFPDAFSKQIYAGWTKDHKAVERQFAGF